MSESTRELRPAAGSPRLAALAEGWTAVALGAGLLLLAWVVRLLLARRIEAPWIMGDELRYAELGKSFRESGRFLFREQPTDLFTLYGVFIAPAWFATKMSTTYGIVKALNVTAMTLSAVPFFFWMRRFMPVVHAVVATVLFLLIPAFVYTGLVMTESLFLPVFIAAAWLLALALERPTVLRQLGALGLAGLATGVRTQGVILFGVVVTAMLLKAWFDLRAEGTPVRGHSALAALRPYAVTWGALLAAVVLYALLKVGEGQSLSSGLGGYAQVVRTNYTFRTSALWVVYHFAEIGLATAIVPACALIVMVAVAGDRRSGLEAAERAFLAVAVTATVWFVIVAGTFASRFSLRVEERNMFYVQPLLLGALLLWIARGCPRPRAATLVAAVVPVGLLVTLPLESLLNVSAFGDTFGLVPLVSLSTSLQGIPEVRVAVMLGAIAAVLLFALVPARWALVVLPLAVGIFFVLSTKSVSGAAHAQSVATRHAYGIGADPSWVDDALPKGQRAAFVYSSPMNGDPHVLWQTEFWNRDVDTVFNYDAPAAGFPGINLVVDGATGRVTPATTPPRIRERYAVMDRNLDLAGPVVASSGGLVLRRLDTPTRLAELLTGIYPDGWMEGHAQVTGYAVPDGRTLPITLSRVELGLGKPPARATLTLHAGGKVPFRRTVELTPKRTVVVRVPIRVAPYRVELDVTPTFDASALGNGDTRQLGAVVHAGP